MAKYYRRFVKSFMAIAKPMTDLTKKDRDFTWGTEEEAAFQKLKEALTSAPILQVFNEDKSGWTPVTTLSVPRWYSKTMTRSDGCQ